MAQPLDDVLSAFTPEQRVRVEGHAQELLGVEQENASRIERRADLLLSMLASDVAAMGGKLRLIAKFLNHKPVTVALGDLSERAPVKPRRRCRDPKAHPAM